MEITNQPVAPNWTFAGWTEEVINETVHAYVFYAGNLYDETNQAINFPLNLKFTADKGYKIKKIGALSFDTPVETHTVNGFKVFAGATQMINFTIVDGSEDESDGVIHFLPIHVMEVSFDGHSDSYHELKKDDLSITYRAPQWKDTDGNGPEHNYSVAYTKNTKPKIGAKFKIKGLPANSQISVGARWDGNVLIESTPGQINGEEVILPIAEAKKEFPDKIGFYQKNEDTAYKIQWQFSLAGDPNLGDVGTTEHQVYVTRTAPAESVTENRETLFYLACNNASTLAGNATSLEVVNKIYENFQSLEISSIDPSTGKPESTGKPDGPFLQYWGTALNQDPHVLVSKTEVCAGWAKFLIEVLSVHRIPAKKVGITCSGIVSENANVVGKGKIPYKFFVEPCDVPKNAAYSEEWEESLPDVPAQGHKTPKVAWPAHAIVQFAIDDETWYYDPSYGTGPFKGLLKYNDSLAGFADVGTWLWQPDGIVSDIKIVP